MLQGHEVPRLLPRPLRVQPLKESLPVGDYTIARLGYLRSGKPEDAVTPSPTPKAAAKGYSKPVPAAPAPEASPLGSPVSAPPPGTVEVKEEAKAEEAGVDVRDMTRCYSGLHFMSTEALDAALQETQQVSDQEQTKMRPEAVFLV